MTRLLQESFGLFEQPGDFILDHDPARRADGFLQFREVAHGLADSLAHYRKLSLDGPPEHPVLFEVREVALLCTKSRMARQESAMSHK